MERERSFQVLSRHEDLSRHIVLQASAGTGKTFSIENIVVRLLVDPEGPLLPEILLVTFTKAATRELKERVRECIEQALASLDSESVEGVPDYLVALIEQGEETLRLAKNRLQRALLSFAEAQIFTIHSFCYRMLRNQLFEGNFSMNLELLAESKRKEEVRRVVKDVLLTEVNPAFMRPIQLKILLKHYRGDSEALISALSRAVVGGEVQLKQEIELERQALMQALDELLDQGPYQSSKIIEDFSALAPFYTGVLKRDGDLKFEVQDSIEVFAQVLSGERSESSHLDLLIEFGVPFCEYLLPEKRKKRGTPPSEDSLHYPQLLGAWTHRLYACLKPLMDPLHLFAHLAKRCQHLLKKRFEEEEYLGPDDLLKSMQVSLENPVFLESLQSQFKAVIIDEFQDTDPIQWQVFKRLYVDNEKAPRIYLVGDPKQSIYRFRYADIYTYFEALHSLGEDALATLDTNYRSHRDLVDALNRFFSSSHISRFIELPRDNKRLAYQPVKAGNQKEGIPFKDDRGRLHFFVASDKKGRSKNWPTESLEIDYLMPYIAREIRHLRKTAGISYRNCAVLVRDRFQAERLAQVFLKWKIPLSLRRSRSLVNSKALPALMELLCAALSPRNPQLVKLALGGIIFGGSEEDIHQLNALNVREAIFSCFVHLGHVLEERGFAAFFEELLHIDSPCGEGSLAEALLKRSDGAQTMDELQQLAELLMEEQSRTACSAEALLAFLEEMGDADEQDERFLLRQDRSLDAVQVLTFHISKGLEFDIVFALGLVNRTPKKESLVAEFSGKGAGSQILLEPNSPEEKAYCAEIDAEKMRALYVGMTRAKDRLYVAAIAANDIQLPVPLGTASPMELFFSRVGSTSEGLEEDYEQIRSLNLDQLCQRIESFDSPYIKYSRLSSTIYTEIEEAQESPCALRSPSPVEVPGASLWISSFSSLRRSQIKSSRETIDTSFIAPPASESSQLQPDLLPAGAEVGNLLHKILAEQKFQLLLGTEADCVITRYLKNSPLEGFEESVKALLHRTLSSALDGEDSSFCLANVDEEKAYKEMEFLFPWDGHIPECGELVHEGCLLKGFIDLVFQYKDRVYIVDYKSNLLSDYSEESLIQAMQAHDYELQAWIYMEALTRYLKALGSELAVGGAFYCFMRGMDGKRGVHYVPHHISHREAVLC